MEALTLRAHFNGTQVVFDEPVTLDQDMKLLVIVLPNGTDPEAEDWFDISAAHFNSAFGDDEPEYSLEDLIEVNPDYVRRG